MMLRIKVELLNDAGEVEQTMFSEETDGLMTGIAMIAMDDTNKEGKGCRMCTLVHGMTSLHMMEAMADSKPFRIAAKFLPLLLEEREAMEAEEAGTEGANATGETCDTQCQ